MAYYKYRNISSNYFENIFSEKSLFCSKYEELNDPSEWYFTSNEEFNTANLQLEKNKYRICSLSRNYWSNLMWCLYANDHKGCCIEVEYSHNSDSGIKKVNISYDENIPQIDIIDNLVDVLSHKTTDWSHEQEVRVIKSDQSRVKEKLSVIIKKIIVGCRTDKDDIKKIKDLLSIHGINAPIYQIKREVFSVPMQVTEEAMKNETGLDSLLEEA